MDSKVHQKTRDQLRAELAALSRRERLETLMHSAFASFDADERGGPSFQRLLKAARASVDDDSFTPAAPRVRH